jgi:hypothetical protein
MPRPKTLTAMKAAMDRGEYRGRPLRVLVGNDEVPVSVMSEDEDELDEHVVDLGHPQDVLMEALRLLGGFTEVDHM